jgi:hypothetical protein
MNELNFIDWSSWEANEDQIFVVDVGNSKFVSTAYAKITNNLPMRAVRNF